MWTDTNKRAPSCQWNDTPILSSFKLFYIQNKGEVQRPWGWHASLKHTHSLLPECFLPLATGRADTLDGGAGGLGGTPSQVWLRASEGWAAHWCLGQQSHACHSLTGQSRGAAVRGAEGAGEVGEGMIDGIMYSGRIWMPAHSRDLIPTPSSNIQERQMDRTAPRLLPPGPTRQERRH